MTSVLPPPPAPCTEWHGFPKQDDPNAVCTVQSLSPATVKVPEFMAIHPTAKEDGFKNDHPIIVSLIRHLPSNSFVLFDLGLGKNYEDYIKKDQLESIEEVFEPKAGEDVDEVLNKIGVKKEDIKFIIISHHHWDHCSHDFSRFSQAQVIVGPFTHKQVPALHTDYYNPSASLKTLELTWSHSPTHILTFRHSHDLFDDGSLLIVPLPGHTPGHIGAVVRTSTESGHEEFVVLAGDCAHHPFCLSRRPEEIHFRPPMWREKGEPVDKPAKHSMHDDHEEAERSLERLKALEKRNEFMVILAHDFRRWNAWKKDEHGVAGVSGWRKKAFKI